MHGGDIYSNNIELDFSVNLNPLGAPEQVLNAVRRSAGKAQQYPDPDYRTLREAIGRKYGVSPSKIVCGNGASELIMAVCRAAVGERPLIAVILTPGFTGYRRALSSVHADIMTVKLREEAGWMPDDSLEEIIAEKKPQLVLFANPSNPTGGMLPGERMRSLARVCRDAGTVFCVDECFMELSDNTLPSLIPVCAQGTEEARNLIVLSAITKTYAVPGIRLGYAFCGSEGLAEALRRVLPEWNVSAAAEAAGIAAMETDCGYLERAGEVIRTERTYLSEKLTACGFHVCPSQADYLLFHGPEGLYDALLKKKILIRDCSDYEGLGNGWYRAAVKRHEENEKLIRAVLQVQNGM